MISKMKTILFILAASQFMFPVSGQFRFGVEGGANISTLVLKNYTIEHAHNSFRPGFNAGPVAEYAFGKHLSFKTSLILETKGANGTYRSDTLNLNGSTSLYYLDIPLLIRGSVKSGDFTFLLNVGPYAGMGLSGIKTLETPDSRTSWDIKWGKDVQDDFKRFDYGIAAGGGIEWNRISLEGSFSLGLANIYSAPQTGYIIQHRVFSLKAGYFF
jgi:hypothetical protein